MKSFAIPGLAAALFLLVSVTARAAEEITKFASQIEVQQNGDLVVTETIAVNAEGRAIKRGIFRDFPARSRDDDGLWATASFEVLEVLRDGNPEPWHTEWQENGVRIYFGSEKFLLPRGPTTYTFRYRTGRQLGFYQEFDELYWNVTGSGWEFPIVAASACVKLPDSTPVLSVEAYTGAPGDQGSAYRTGTRPGCDAYLETTAELPPGQGISIVVTWPKGIVEEPTPVDRFIQRIFDNIGLLAGVIGIAVATVYFLVMWAVFGKDPARSTVIAQFAPPTGFTPQDVRYLHTLGKCDNTSFAAAVLHLAVQGAVKIEERLQNKYTLVKGDGKLDDEGEHALQGALFSASPKLKLDQTNYARVQSARKKLADTVRSKAGAFFSRNTHIWIVGLIITLIPLAISLVDAESIAGALFALLWMSGWSVGCAALSVAVLSAWKAPSKWKAIPLTFFAVPFFLGWIFGLFMLILLASPTVCVLYVIGISLCVVFQHLLKRPTKDGQLIRDHIAGFRHYLAVAESDRLSLENPPERTPELFEQFLPYALALDVQQAWAEKFRGVLEAANYQPTWHSGSTPGTRLGATAFAGGFISSFGSAISSAATSPSSRTSGSGGGGSSGGGGGGGGGGGW